MHAIKCNVYVDLEEVPLFSDTGSVQYAGNCKRQCNCFQLHVPTVNEPQEETRCAVGRVSAREQRANTSVEVGGWG